MVEDALKSQCDTLCGMVIFCRNLVHSLIEDVNGVPNSMSMYLAKVARAKKGLQQGIHITCSTLVFQSDKTSLFL